MSHQLKGVSIKLIHPTQKITETFSKREFVVTEAGNYPQHIIFQVTQDKCALLDSFQVNETVDVNFNLRGREWTSPQGEVKYFNSLEAWRIEKHNLMLEHPPQVISVFHRLQLLLKEETMIRRKRMIYLFKV